ncbi:SDR family NAD(P)-dependent oxidoreductase [Aquibacillus saliphilus]|uniref:SDR family NAD(P)-dependent oxidoreductase n=1 Tax=Aquibacillus saliphilus TaxID=1909422 RepID=UPI001CF04607|nr:SDR family oxidoreductase [Aquibacillus saliphilus]
MSSLYDLKGKVAFVTGAGLGGLGAQTAIAFAKVGCDVVVADLPSREQDLKQTVQKINEYSKNSFYVTMDITKENQIDDAITEVIDKFGKLDILVNSAGVMLRKPTFETSLLEWQKIIDVNLTGTWLLARRAGRELTKQGHGKIINFSSLYANMVGPLPEPAYYASKAGVVNLTRGLASEWGKQNVQVNCIAPGVFFPTNMTEPLADQPGRLEQMADRTLLGRLGDPEKDISGVVLFLASAASDYITGQLIAVDGGWSAW